MTRRMKCLTAARSTGIVVAAVIIAAAAAHAELREERLEKRAPLDGAKRIVVKNARGDIRIAGERDRGDVGCEYFVQARGRKRDEVERVFAAMTVEIARVGDDLVIEAVYPERGQANRGFLSFIMQQYTNMRIDFDISVPEATALIVSGGRGDIEVARVDGAVKISAASGDIDARQLGASLEIQVSSGDVVVEDVMGPVEISAASGDIDMKGVKKDAVVQSASGEIAIFAIDGDLVLSSTSGDVTVDGVGSVRWSGTSGSAIFAGVRGGVAATTASGDIEITAAPAGPANYGMTSSSGDIALIFAQPLPGGFALRAQTTVGEISVRLPIQPHTVSRRYLSGVVGDGRSVVTAETSSGDIVITSRGE